MRDLIVFSGPNGSGKTTYVGAFAPDMIYICPDDYVKLFPDTEPIEDRYRKAADKAAQDRMLAVRNGDSFSFETVLSKSEKLDFIQFARRMGYRITIIHTTTSHPDINIRRIKKRVEQGGHDVREVDTIRRYNRSMELLPDIVTTSDYMTIYDNSQDDATPLPVMYKLMKNCYFVNENRRPIWCETLKAKLERIPELFIQDITEEEYLAILGKYEENLA